MNLPNLNQEQIVAILRPLFSSLKDEIVAEVFNKLDASNSKPTLANSIHEELDRNWSQATVLTMQQELSTLDIPKLIREDYPLLQDIIDIISLDVLNQAQFTQLLTEITNIKMAREARVKGETYSKTTNETKKAFSKFLSFVTEQLFNPRCTFFLFSLYFPLIVFYSGIPGRLEIVNQEEANLLHIFR